MSDDDTKSEVSEILASCDNNSPKKKENYQTFETSSDPFELGGKPSCRCHCLIHHLPPSYSPVPEGVEQKDIRQNIVGTKKQSLGKCWRNVAGEFLRYRFDDTNVKYKIRDTVFIDLDQILRVVHL